MFKRITLRHHARRFSKFYKEMVTNESHELVIKPVLLDIVDRSYKHHGALIVKENLITCTHSIVSSSKEAADIITTANISPWVHGIVLESRDFKLRDMIVTHKNILGDGARFAGESLLAKSTDKITPPFPGIEEDIIVSFIQYKLNLQDLSGCNILLIHYEINSTIIALLLRLNATVTVSFRSIKPLAQADIVINMEDMYQYIFSQTNIELALTRNIIRSAKYMELKSLEITSTKTAHYLN